VRTFKPGLKSAKVVSNVFSVVVLYIRMEHSPLLPIMNAFRLAIALQISSAC
jgi:hypothetical protein